MDPSRRPWERWYPPGITWDTPIATGTLPALLDQAAADWGPRPAIRFRDRIITYAALHTQTERLARGLMAAGLPPGARVALLLPNTPWHPLAFFAVLRAGGVVVHLSPLDAPRQLAHKLADSGARWLIATTLPGILPAARDLLATGAVDRLLLGDDAAWGAAEDALPVPDGIPTLGSLMADGAADWPDLRPDDLALLQYTGGTTGQPRAAMLRHANLTAAVSSYVAFATAEARAPGQRVVGVLPLFHIFALTRVLLRSLRLGHEVLLHRRFDVAAVLHDIGTLRAGLMAGVPTMWIALANHPDAAACDFASLREAMSGGAPMPADVAARVRAIIGTRLGNGWGMTELCPTGTSIPPGAPDRPGCVGVPAPGIDLRVVALDDPSVAVPPGGRGELAVKGRNVFAGYWNRAQESEACFHDGWFLTGDVGTMDSDGLFRIVDRKTSMIISGGFNVYPAVIENAIHEHPAVRETIVAGVPDAYRGQAAKAFVTLRDGAAPFDLADLRAFLADRLGRHELPAALEFRAELPRSPVGKLLRSVLEAEIAQQHRSV